MSRQFKFRVWDKIENRWGNNAYLECCGVTLKHILYHDKPENYVIQQFTGLTDKNGKEIYEGDILQMIYNTGERGEISEVIFQVISSDGVISGFECQIQSPRNSEVIGNIFENPELLK